jgi:K+-sensing histidine kinase KdpD
MQEAKYFFSVLEEPVSWSVEILVIIGMLFVGAITIKLHAFIHSYAEILRQRNNNAQTLYDQNHQLKMMLKKYECYIFFKKCKYNAILGPNSLQKSLVSTLIHLLLK